MSVDPARIRALHAAHLAGRGSLSSLARANGFECAKDLQAEFRKLGLWPVHRWAVPEARWRKTA